MSRVTQDTTKPQSASDTGLSPSMVKLSRLFSSPNGYYSVVLQPRQCVATLAVWALPRSLATTGGIISLFSLPRGTKMFQFPRLASRFCRMDGLQPPGLSHSEICGSMAICAYPQLIAAYHVLHRLNEPRHPPCALSYFLSTLLSCHIRTGGDAHTSAVFVAGASLGSTFLYSLACVNMSKIFFPERDCGEYRIRTDDPLLAKQVL